MAMDVENLFSTCLCHTYKELWPCFMQEGNLNMSLKFTFYYTRKCSNICQENPYLFIDQESIMFSNEKT